MSRALRIERPNGSLQQPLPDDLPGQLAYLARLAPLVPHDATWRTVEDRPLHGPPPS